MYTIKNITLMKVHLWWSSNDVNENGMDFTQDPSQLILILSIKSHK